MREAVLGATAMGSFCIALFFTRFWRETRDPLHVYFAIAFALLGIQRAMLVAWEHPNESSPALYVPRLLAYLVIIAGIVAKNLRQRGGTAGP